MRRLLCLLFNTVYFSLFCQNNKVYEFPIMVQNAIEKQISLEKKDSLEICFLMLYNIKEKETLSYYCINKNYHDSLTSLILDCNLVANICGKHYPLLLFSDFLYSNKLNYKKDKNKVWLTNVKVPLSRFDISFRGKPYEEGEIIEQ